MFWHLRMILASKKTLGKFTKLLGFEKTLPPHLGKIPKKSRFFLDSVPNALLDMLTGEKGEMKTEIQSK